MKEFIRFGYQENICPALLHPDELVVIFRQVIRERIELIEGKNGVNMKDVYFVDRVTTQQLDFEYFKRALIRIAVVAQDNLGGQVEDLLASKLDRDRRSQMEATQKRDRILAKIKAKEEGEDDEDEGADNEEGTAGDSKPAKKKRVKKSTKVSIERQD